MSCGCLKGLVGMLKGGGGQKATQPQQPAQPAQPNQPAQPAPAHPPQPATPGAPPADGNSPGNAVDTAPSTNVPDATPATLEIDFVNQTNGSQPVFGFITGQAIDKNNALFLLSSDGQTPYYPTNPSSTNAALATNVAVPLGGPGATTRCTIPRVAGGRIWFSYGRPLKFQLNPGPNGPALVEPSVTNPTDPSINIEWGFAEFTYNSAQLFANISYVDFVSLPIALDLYDTKAPTQHVSGMPTDGLTTIVKGLNAQNASDGAGWNKLIVNGSNGQPLRVLSPNAAAVGNNGIAANYWNAYIDQIWSKYSSTPLQVDTQASFGTVSGTVKNNVLTFSGGATFTKPTGADIFSCSSGPFSGSSPEQLAITPRLAAAFNRSTLQTGAVQPDGVTPSQYYQVNPTNHYSRIVHAANVDKRGYAFPYDDVVPNGGSDVAGTVFTGTPSKLVVSVGGANAHA